MVKKPKINKNKKGKNKMIMKILSLFSGIGAFEKALNQLNVKYELVNYCEIDKYASKAYSLIHNVSENMNLGDITKVDTSKLPKDIDLITYGFPCQDISLAGKQQGMFNDDGSKTRSGLFFEALRIIEDTKPKIAIAENVKNLVSKKFNAQFQAVLQSLEEAGYNNYWKVLNAKDFGIPQNRERVFIVSIRKDIDPGSFEFPKPFELKLRLKDMLEDEVDEKYFLSDKMIEYIIADNEKWEGSKKSVVNKSVATCITTGESTRRCDASNYIVKGLPEDTDIKLMQVGQMYGTEKEPNPQAGRVYNPNGLSPTMDTCSGGNRMPKIIVAGKTKSGGERSLILDEEGICNCLSATDYKQPKQILIREATKKGYAVAEEGDGVYLNRPYQKRGVVQKGMIQTIKCNGNDLGVVVAAAKRGRGEGWKKQIEVSDREVVNLWTETQAKMITPEGNIKRYIGSDIIDIFKEGQVADISFPNGYNKGPRVHDECPTLNGTTTKSSFVVKVKDKVGNEIHLYTNYKKLVETVEKNEMPVDEVKHMDLYNRNLTDNCGTLSDPCHNNNRLWDGLRIRKLTPKECFRLMGFEDKDIECLIENKISNTQLYKMAGNSIVVDVLKYIFVELFKVINIHYKEA